MIHKANLSKLYYSIGEVAEMFEVNPSLIRFWEKEFPSLNPKKNKKGNRRFSPDDILEIQRIYRLVKKNGHTLAGAKNALQNKTDEQSEKEIHAKLILKLEQVKEKLLRLKSSSMPSD